MKKNILSVLLLSFLLLLSVIFPAWSEEIKTNSEQSAFTLEVKDSFISLKAEHASLKEILNDFEKKTGLKVKIFE